MDLHQIASRVAILFGKPRKFEPVKTYSIAEEDGVTEFDDGSIYFWTSGSGGYVVSGGLGFWPPDDIEIVKGKMKEAAGFIDDGEVGHTVVYLDDWSELPDDILQKAKKASQSGSSGKYDLGQYLP